VEQKLGQTTTTNDTLQSMLVNLRSMEGVQQELEIRYDRLEKKKNVIDSTIDGVDRSFQAVSDLEKKLDIFKEELNGATGTLDTVEKKVKDISARKEMADRVVKQIGQIDRILSELEGRIENLQKAREWLASTETRLEEVNRQAQDQVKLLGSLLKDEAGRPAVRKEGAKTSMSARETVTRLAHQGWTVEQIAKATKLSRGEVELILELSSSK
jgi:predicted  nucleic acid-binding Zn-ribbon protein